MLYLSLKGIAQKGQELGLYKPEPNSSYLFAKLMQECYCCDSSKKRNCILWISVVISFLYICFEFIFLFIVSFVLFGIFVRISLHLHISSLSMDLLAL